MDNLVYSTDHGSMCPGCLKPVKSCVCRQLKKAAAAPADGVVRLRYETKGRKGKGMTVITGLPLSEDGLRDLAGRLKQRLGAGGSVKGHVIELQGDHRVQAAEELRAQGYVVT